MNQTNPTVLVILVNYHNETETIDFVINQLLPQNYDPLFIMVIDNGSKEKDKMKISFSSYNNIFLLMAQSNLGYFGGAQYAYDYFLNYYKFIPDSVIISNTDITLVNNNFFEILASKIKKENFEVLGPDITSTFLKRKQNPYMLKRISKTKINLIRILTLSFFCYNGLLLLHYINHKLTPAKVFINSTEKNQVYGIHGSFMIFHKIYFLKGGSFKFGSFLFGEEIYVAEICRMQNLKTIFDSELKVIHNEHATTGIFKSKKMVKMMHDSYKYLYFNFFKN